MESSIDMISREEIERRKGEYTIPRLWETLDCPGEAPPLNGSFSSPHRRDRNPSGRIFENGQAFQDHGHSGVGPFKGDSISFLGYALGIDNREEYFKRWIEVTGGDTESPQATEMLENERAEWRQRKRERETREARKRKEREQARKDLPVILNQYNSSFYDLLDSSPIRIDDGVINPQESLIMLDALFGPFGDDYCVWNGRDHFDTGPETFRPIGDWLEHGLRGKLITTCLFPNDGGAGRTNERARKTGLWPYVVIECDEIFQDPDTGVFRKPVTREEKEENLKNGLAIIDYLRAAGMVLQAVVYTGNKSTHAYFDNPGKKFRGYLENVCSCLKIDNSFSVPVQPWRLPGFLHEKKFDDCLCPSELFYLKGGCHE